MNRTKAYAAFATLLTAPFFSLLSPATAFDPASYSVPLKNHHGIVYVEEHSLYTLKIRGEGFKGITTPWQSILRTRRRGNTISLLVRTGAKTTPHRLKRREKYLRDTRFLNLTDPLLRAMAVRFKKTSSLVNDVEKHVNSYMTNSTTGIPLIPARSIIRSRSGDCTEYTILTVALLRSRGVPARAVVGLILIPEFQGKENVLVYHMWAEAWHKGRWHLVDATRPGWKRNNRYIALAYHSLTSEMPLSYFRAIAAIEKLEVFYSGEVETRR